MTTNDTGDGTSMPGRWTLSGLGNGPAKEPAERLQSGSGQLHFVPTRWHLRQLAHSLDWYSRSSQTLLKGDPSVTGTAYGESSKTSSLAIEQREASAFWAGVMAGLCVVVVAALVFVVAYAH